MAVTAHWIELYIDETPKGPQKRLRLQADLIGFHQIPGHHYGEHLAHCFLYLLDRIKITNKVHALSDLNLNCN